MTDCQLLINPPADGAWNMAVDEVLLGVVGQSGVPILRFYQWARPTLSLGYFQQFADRSLHPASSQADIVRRLSGGGAILHDRELTYSLILPATHPAARDTQALYDTVHRAIVATLNAILADEDSQWQAVLCTGPAKLPARDEPFLCFQRRSAGDILLSRTSATTSATDMKIVGSAQRRRQGVVLQHGSVLLQKSEVAPELPGIAEITRVEISPNELLSRLPSCLAEILLQNQLEIQLDAATLAEIQELTRKKYSCDGWTERR